MLRKSEINSGGIGAVLKQLEARPCLGHKCHFDAKIARGGESLADIRAYIHKGRQDPQPAPVVDGDE